MRYFRVFIILIFPLSTSVAYDPTDVRDQLNKTPDKIEGVGIDERLGHNLDPNIEFTDDTGQSVKIGKYFESGKPVIFSMVYYSCPSLCNYHLNGLTETLKNLNWTVGKEFEIVAVSMDHRESFDVAGPKKANYISEYGRPESASGWHFLTGDKASVDKLAGELGFKFRWLEEEQEFSHAAAAMILTPSGQISRYLHGIKFLPETLRMALLEASDGQIGSVIDQVLMFCFQFDPKKNKYTIYAWRLMQIGGLIMVVVLAIFLAPIWLRERR